MSSSLIDIARKTRDASRQLALLTTTQKNEAIDAIALALGNHQNEIPPICCFAQPIHLD